MRAPIISIDRSKKQFAVFDEFDMVTKFEPYASEDEAVAKASAFIKKYSDVAPSVVYPSTNKMEVSYR